MIRMMESCVFSAEYDEVFGQGMRNKKSLSAQLACSPLKDLMDEIREAAKSPDDSMEDVVEEETGAPVIVNTESLANDPVLTSGKAMTLAEEQRRLLKRCENEAKSLVANYVTLAVETMEEAEVLTSLQNSPAGQRRGELAKKTHVLVFYDPQEGGEASAQPRLRRPPLRNKKGSHAGHLEKCMQTVLGRHGAQWDDLAEGDIYMINDSSRPGNRPCFLNAMVASNGKVISSKSSKLIYLHISEESLTKRLDRFRGHSLGSVQQLQGLHVFTSKVMKLNQHSKDACEGSNRGNVVGPLAMDDYDNGDLTWRVVVQEKFEILGRNGARIPAADEQGAAKTRDRFAKEPMLFHCLPMAFYQEMLASVDAVAAISLAGEGKLALQCIPYWGLCFTDKHKECLIDLLAARIFKLMRTSSGGKLYKPELAELWSQLEAGEGTVPTPTPKAKAKGEAKAKVKAKAKASAQSGASGAGAAGGNAAAAAEASEADLLEQVKALAAQACQGGGAATGAAA
eukprot:s227_g3.t1